VQHGVVAHWQLIAGGLSRGAIQRLITAGWLHRLYVGVYAVGHDRLSWHGRCLAAVFACGPGAVLSHRAAGALWAIRPTSSPRLDVTLLRPRKGPRGLCAHHVRSLHAEDRAERDGIPLTSVARTLLDLAEVVPRRELIRAVEQAERLGLFDLATVEGEPPRVNSDWERDLLDFCDEHDLPRPELNVTVEGYEVDALWSDAKLIVELDSWDHHRSRRAFEEDRRRDAALQLAGHVVLRITWRRFEQEPEEVAQSIRRRV
jgi:hypothetical protein